jgi:hypothetical protein
LAQLVGIRGQQTWDNLYDASGTITTGGTAQLVLAQSINRSYFHFVNISDTAMYLEFGGARATAALSGTGIASCSITNAGQGYTLVPSVEFFGGGNPVNSAFLGGNQAGYPAPSRVAKAHAVLSGATIGSIVIDDPGSGYKIAPQVFLRNNPNDIFGVATPSATSGTYIAANGGSIYFNGTSCTTDAVSVFCATTGKAFNCKWMA